MEKPEPADLESMDSSRPVGEQPTKARFKVTLYVPRNKNSLALIIPHAWTATLLSLRQAALARAVKLGFTLPTSCPEPTAHLGGADGGILFDDDVLEELVLDPGAEEVWFVFADGERGWVRGRSRSPSNRGDEPQSTKRTRLDLPPDVSPSAPTLLNLRIITPNLAKVTTQIEDIPPLPTHFQIGERSTLLELKRVIGNHAFGIEVASSSPTSEKGHGECNCLLARKILRGGTKHHVTFLDGPTMDIGGVEDNLVCDICSGTLRDPCTDCAAAHERETIRCGYLKHVGCDHVFHQHCSEKVDKDDRCPVRKKPHPINSLNREYLPADTANGFLVVVHGRSVIDRVLLPPTGPVAGSSSSINDMLAVADLKVKLSRLLGTQCSVADKVANIFGATIVPSGTSSGSEQSGSGRGLLFGYSCVISICSKTKHTPPHGSKPPDNQIALFESLPPSAAGDSTNTNPTRGPSGLNLDSPATTQEQYDVDIHTADAPIVCADEHRQLAQLHLDDYAIGGVINLYATVRMRTENDKLSTASSGSEEIGGMDEIFMERDHWRVPFIQTERGMATFLSATRVFASKLATVDRPTQNSILALFMHLTHFPPILRPLHTLMTRKTLTPDASAVMVQCVYELVRDLLTPGQAIENKRERVLEGSRLFYYLALELAREFFNPSATEYIDAMKHVGLADAETFQPLSEPITTNIGVIETAYFKALTEGMLSGLAHVTKTNPTADELRILKLVQRTGGTMTDITVFESDLLQLAMRDSPAISQIRPSTTVLANCPRELNYNFRELSQQSAMGTFAVVPPMNLRMRGVQAPALSLDRDGLMAVFVGRPACAPPHKDITIFRPTRGGSLDIDVAVVTQLLEPILRQRTEDGSIALDSLGEAEAKAQKSPNEIIILCVDCSTSMTKPAGFEGLNDEDSDGASDEADDSSNESEYSDTDLDERDEPVHTIDEGLEILSSHENFSDILATIRARMFNWQKRDAATSALTIVLHLYTTELKELVKERHEREKHLTTRFLNSPGYLLGNPTLQRIDRLKKYVECISKLKTELETSLVEQASRPTGIRGAIGANQASSPTDPLQASTTESTITMQLPPTFQCPISHELFDAPVVAEDGFTYDKLQIEKWFQMTGTKSSPMTGLAMGTVLLPNRNLATQIREWREGVDILRAEIQDFTAPRTGRFWRLAAASGLVVVRMLTQTNHWDFRLPAQIRYESLRTLGFRCVMKDSFTLLHNGEPLKQVWTPRINAYTVAMKSGMNITIQLDGPVVPGQPSTPLAPLANRTRTQPESERVLIKVYNNRADSRTPIFTFWILKSTKSTVGTILFRYWAHNAGSTANSYEVWTDIRYTGDGHINGQHLKPWQPLAGPLSSSLLDGTTEDNDPLYKKIVEDEFTIEGAHNPHNPPEKKAKVLKLLLVPQRPATRKKQKDIGKTLTRMDVVKQVFDNYINRTLAYDIPNHIGLITFATKPAVKQPITGVIEDLRNALSKLECSGDTAMWDALNLAAEYINTYSVKFPEAKKRIVCLSDGADTNSKAESWRLCQQFQHDTIVLDSITIGEENNAELRGISYGTGGYKFFPKELESAVAICELETVLSQDERPEIAGPPPVAGRNSNPVSEFRRYTNLATVDIVNEDTYPARKSHPSLQDEFIGIPAVVGSRKEGTASQNVIGIKLGDGRILQEMRLITTNNQPFYDVYISERNMRFWKVVMEAPPDSTYTGGTYLLYLDMDEYYPRSPPKARFVTPILHPNINKHGRICHSILDRDWTSDTTLVSLLNVIWSLLLVPNKDDFANVVMSLNYLWDEVGHQERVRAHVRKHATNSRDKWREQIISTT